jgi:hypothetical protein
LMDHGGLIWIDHHKTAIDQYSATTTGYRIDGVAACRLTWQWFTNWTAVKVMNDPAYLPIKEFYINRIVEEPLAVRLAGEYDIWDKRDPQAELFQHGLRSQELTPEDWNSLLGSQCPVLLDELLIAGQALQYAKAEENKSIIAKNGFTVQWEGLTFLACNAGSYNSHLFVAGIRPEHDGLLGFCLRANGKWAVSLYGVPGKPQVDLSAIAKRHGGGGHKQACGFTCDSIPFLSV